MQETYTSSARTAKPYEIGLLLIRPDQVPQRLGHWATKLEQFYSQ